MTAYQPVDNETNLFHVLWHPLSRKHVTAGETPELARDAMIEYCQRSTSLPELCKIPGSRDEWYCGYYKPVWRPKHPLYNKAFLGYDTKKRRFEMYVWWSPRCQRGV